MQKVELSLSDTVDCETTIIDGVVQMQTFSFLGPKAMIEFDNVGPDQTLMNVSLGDRHALTPGMLRELADRIELSQKGSCDGLSLADHETAQGFVSEAKNYVTGHPVLKTYGSVTLYYAIAESYANAEGLTIYDECVTQGTYPEQTVDEYPKSIEFGELEIDNVISLKYPKHGNVGAELVPREGVVLEFNHGPNGPSVAVETEEGIRHFLMSKIFDLKLIEKCAEYEYADCEDDDDNYYYEDSEY